MREAFNVMSEHPLLTVFLGIIIVLSLEQICWMIVRTVTAYRKEKK